MPNEVFFSLNAIRHMKRRKRAFVVAAIESIESPSDAIAIDLATARAHLKVGNVYLAWDTLRDASRKLSFVSNDVFKACFAAAEAITIES